MSRLFFFFISLYFVLPATAHAYLDPGSGSYFFQLIVAGLFGAAFVIKLYWKKITSWLSRFFSRKKNGKGRQS